MLLAISSSRNLVMRRRHGVESLVRRVPVRQPPCRWRSPYRVHECLWLLGGDCVAGARIRVLSLPALWRCKDRVWSWHLRRPSLHLSAMPGSVSATESPHEQTRRAARGDTAALALLYERYGELVQTRWAELVADARVEEPLPRLPSGRGVPGSRSLLGCAWHIRPVHSGSDRYDSLRGRRAGRPRTPHPGTARVAHPAPLLFSPPPAHIARHARSPVNSARRARHGPHAPSNGR
jgi:hypothetical protein